jgi:hypothetical protein
VIVFAVGAGCGESTEQGFVVGWVGLHGLVRSCRGGGFRVGASLRRRVSNTKGYIYLNIYPLFTVLVRVGFLFIDLFSSRKRGRG